MFEYKNGTIYLSNMIFTYKCIFENALVILNEIFSNNISIFNFNCFNNNL